MDNFFSNPQVQILKVIPLISVDILLWTGMSETEGIDRTLKDSVCKHLYLLLWLWGGGCFLLVSWASQVCDTLLWLQASLLICEGHGDVSFKKYLVNQWLEEWELNELSLAKCSYDLIALVFWNHPAGTYWLSGWHMDVFLAASLVRWVDGWDMEKLGDRSHNRTTYYSRYWEQRSLNRDTW